MLILMTKVGRLERASKVFLKFEIVADAFHPPDRNDLRKKRALES